MAAEVVVVLAVVGGFLSGWLTRWIAFLFSFPFGLCSFRLREIRGMAWNGHENKVVWGGDRGDRERTWMLEIRLLFS